jgi:hypothetical protein
MVPVLDALGGGELALWLGLSHPVLLLPRPSQSYPVLLLG